MPKLSFKRTLTRSQAEAELAQLEDLVDRYQARWVLALAVSNSAGLTLMGGKVADLMASAIGAEKITAATTIALFLPSLWLFAAGLLSAGAAHVGEHFSYWYRQNLSRQLVARMTSPDQFIEFEEEIPSALNIARSWFLEIASAVLFLAAVTYPLFVIALRYFEANGVHLP